ncbi:MAG: hypothetical protein ACRCZY_08285 [Phocaeicola sp.]
MKSTVERVDLIGDIRNFPIEVVQRMCECQVEQGQRFDPKVFSEYKDSRAFVFNGFAYSATMEGYSFWREVIENENFDLFFKKYPKKEPKIETEFKIPKGYEFDCVEDGVVKLKAINEERTRKRIGFLKWLEQLIAEQNKMV